MSLIAPPSAPTAEPAARDAPASTPRAPFLLWVGIFVCFIGVIVLEPGLPQNTAFVDPVIFFVAVIGLLAMLRWPSEAVTGFGKALPWLWLYLLGSFIGLAHVGITYWSLQSLARSLFAVLTFFAVWHIIDVYRLERLALKAVFIAGVVATGVLVLPGYTWRSDGWFPNPNYAGHFGVSSGFVIVLTSKRTWMKVVGFVIIGVSIHASGSFGSIAMTAVMTTVILMRSMQKHNAILLAGLVGVAIVAGLFLSSPRDEVPNGGLAEKEVTSSISGNRFDRTTSGRGEIWGHGIEAWKKEPFGIGPNGYKYRRVFVNRGRPLEIHSDPIGILVERGFIGLIGWAGFWIAIWRFARPGGLARILIAGDVVQSLFRETFNYRHMWLLLALLFVLDHRATQARTRELEGNDEPDEVDAPAVTSGNGHIALA